MITFGKLHVPTLANVCKPCMTCDPFHNIRQVGSTDEAASKQLIAMGVTDRNILLFLAQMEEQIDYIVQARAGAGCFSLVKPQASSRAALARCLHFGAVP